MPRSQVEAMWNRIRVAAMVVAPLLALPDRLTGQAELQGRVFEESRHGPVANAEVAVPRLNLHSKTDSLGHYRLQNIPRGEHLVITRAVGYRPDSALTVFDGDE